jgi:Histidine kinase-, DNA gyrase B-, and HSP90-like ATPase
MVRQFADAFAFIRELVQNGIDAGAAAIEVTVERSAEGVASVRVADDGCGMTLAVIEDALLVLFRSTKESDATKIGKYGVGFMSVFAIEPSEVTVDSWRAGHSHRLRLFPDHTYEIERAAPRDGHGTTVTLAKTLPAEQFQSFWQKAAASLHRWCRHAEVPIHLTLTNAATREPAERTRIDTPLAVRAIVSVRHVYEDMEIVLGPLAGSGGLPSCGSGEDEPAPFAGFYNRGLTLYESTEALNESLAGVRFKVKSPRLSHTLSRDDVRRERAFHLALARVAALRSGELRAAVLRELSACAEAAAMGEKASRLAALLDAATCPPVTADGGELQLPLAHQVEGRWTLSLERIVIAFAGRFRGERPTLPVSAERTDLTKALAARGVPVAFVPEGSGVVQAVERVSQGAVVPSAVASECLLARELTGAERLPGDDALCAGLSDALAGAGVERVALGRVDGGRIAAVVARHSADSREHVVSVKAADLAGQKWPRGALLVLHAEAEPVACARRATSPAIAAHLLARYLLLKGPGLSSRAGEELALRALEEIQ